MRQIQYQITKEDSGLTILDFLKKQEYSYHLITQLKKTNRGILLGDDWKYVVDPVTEGDLLTIVIEEHDTPSQILAKDLAFPIIYEDEDYFVINKPADMPIHPSLHNYENTLANAAAYHYKKNKETFVYRCVNRLDRDTTGLTILAKHGLSSAILGKQVQNHSLSRSYLAIVKGNLPEKKSCINAPIARKGDSIIERVVDFEKGESACTHYEVLAESNGYSLLRLRLETGRTHQIRVHMKYLGFPLIGDALYNPKDHSMARQALHSAKLEFTHPITKKAVSYWAPLPLDMQKFFPDFDVSQL